MRLYTFGRGLRQKYIVKPQTEEEAKELEDLNPGQVRTLFLRYRLHGVVIQRVDGMRNIPAGLAR